MKPTKDLATLLRALLPLSSLLLMLLLCASSTEAAQRKHISFVSLGMRGHISPMLPMAEELMNRGHHVSFLMPEELHMWVRKELRDNPQLEIISTGKSTLSPDKVHAIFRDYSRNVKTFDSPLSAAYAFSDRALFVDLFLEESLALYREGMKHFGSIEKHFIPDVFIIDPFTTTGFDLARTFEKEWIVFHPGLICFLEHYVGRNQPWIPRSNSGFPADMSLFQRLINPIVSPLIIANVLPFISALNSPRTELGIKVPDHPFDDFEGKLIISASAPPLQVARELPPTVQMVGPMIFDTLPSHPLDHKLEAFLKSSSDPVIVFSFGTLVVPTPEQIKNIVGALEYKRVVWVMGKKNQEETKFRDLIIGSEFFVTEWAPQQQLLAHPSVKLFVSHCGANSVHETMWFAKPVVCIPFFADQFDFARRVEEAGVGVFVDKFSIDAKSLAFTINKILADHSFTENAQHVSSIFRGMRGVKKAADLVEMQLFTGISHLIPPSPRTSHEIIATLTNYSLVIFGLYVALRLALFLYRRFVQKKEKKD